MSGCHWISCYWWRAGMHTTNLDYILSELLDITISWFSWFLKGLIMWCNYLNLPDCSTCSNSCLCPLSHDIYITYYQSKKESANSPPCNIVRISISRYLIGNIWYLIFRYFRSDIWFCHLVLAFMKCFWEDFKWLLRVSQHSLQIQPYNVWVKKKKTCIFLIVFRLLRPTESSQ